MITAPAASTHPGDGAWFDTDVLEDPAVEFRLPRLIRLVGCSVEQDRCGNDSDSFPDLNGAIRESANQQVHSLLLQMTMRHRTSCEGD